MRILCIRYIEPITPVKIIATTAIVNVHSTGCGRMNCKAKEK